MSLVIHEEARRVRIPGPMLALMFAACLLGLASCATAGTGTVEYSVSAQQNYQKGLARLEAKDWVAAAKYFSFIKARFPYSKYAVLAELRMADAELGAGHQLQAIDSFQLFVRFHPTHQMVTTGYASFRICEAYMQMLPEDWWILPPSYEKDQATTTDAARELESFLAKYPRSTFVPRAKTMLQKVHLHLARHEWYVANFYWDRGKPAGTVLRLRTLLDKYPGVGFDGDALWLLGRAYARIAEPERAKKAWQQLVDEHPNHKHASDARSALARLRG